LLQLKLTKTTVNISWCANNPNILWWAKTRRRYDTWQGLIGTHQLLWRHPWRSGRTWWFRTSFWRPGCSIRSTAATWAPARWRSAPCRARTEAGSPGTRRFGRTWTGPRRVLERSFHRTERSRLEDRRKQSAASWGFLRSLNERLKGHGISS